MYKEEEMFKPFRPYCSALISKPNMTILEKLKELIQNSDRYCFVYIFTCKKLVSFGYSEFYKPSENKFKKIGMEEN